MGTISDRSPGLLAALVLVAIAHAGDAAAQGSACGGFVATAGIQLGDGSRATGDLIATMFGARVRVGRNVVVAAEGGEALMAATEVSLGNGATVCRVRADVLQEGRNASIACGRETGPPPDVGCSVSALPCEGPDVVVGKGEERTLEPGDHGRLVLQNGAALVLEPGTQRFCEIATGRNATIVVSGGDDAVDVAGDVRLGNGSSLTAAGGAPIRILRAGGMVIDVGAGGTLAAHVIAPRATLRLERGATLTGDACVDAIHTGQNVALLCVAGAPSSTSTTTPPTTSSTAPSTSSTTSTSTTSTTSSSTSSTTSSSTSTSSSSSTTSSATTSSTTSSSLPTTTSSSSTSATAPPTTSTSTSLATTTSTSSTSLPPPTTSSSTTTTTSSSTVPPTTTTTLGGVLDFTTTAAGGICAHSRNAAGAVLKNLTCGGLNIGNGNSTVVENLTPDGATNRFTVSECSGTQCTLGPTPPSVATPTLDCTSMGCFFGPPLPISNGGTSSCVVNTLAADAAGTIDLATGVIASLSVNLASRVVVTGVADQPCPRCTGFSGTPTPASPKTGTCDRGANVGDACLTTNSAGLSKDCPPVAGEGDPPSFEAGILAVDLTPLVTEPLQRSSATGLFCPGQATAGCFRSEPGAPGLQCRSIDATGSAAGNLLPAGTVRPVTLASIFCVPRAADQLLNFAAGLPGPGEVTLVGTLVLR